MVWDAIIAEGRRVVQRLADLEMPIVAAVNGPATVHSEYALLADIVVASETTVFGDFPHLTFGLVPGDGLHVIWEEVLGLNRSRHLILTQGTFTAAEALSWGAIAEVVAQENVIARAMEIAEGLAYRPQLLNRYIATTIRQRLSRRMAEGAVLGMALEGITAANMPYLRRRLSVAGNRRRCRSSWSPVQGRPMVVATMRCSASAPPVSWSGRSARILGSSIPVVSALIRPGR